MIIYIMDDETHILPLLFIEIYLPNEVDITWMRLKAEEFRFWMNSILGSKEVENSQFKLQEIMGHFWYSE